MRMTPIPGWSGLFPQGLLRRGTLLPGLLLSGVLLVSGMLGGCGHREKKAPCSASEGGGTGITAFAPETRANTRAATGLALFDVNLSDHCGPLRPVNAPVTSDRSASGGFHMSVPTPAVDPAEAPP